MKILALEPYYGGSHRAFLDGWMAASRHNFHLLTLPPNKWKWRMRHGAVTFAEKVRQLAEQGNRWNALLCSDMLNLAEFLGLAGNATADMQKIVYFHENQLTYPVRFESERDYQFAMTNLTTALAATEVWFNSAFHRDEFLTAMKVFLKKMPDNQPIDAIKDIQAKSAIPPPGIRAPAICPSGIHPPGINAPAIRPPGIHPSAIHPPGINASGIHPPGIRSSGINALPSRAERKTGPLKILWAARWEHDKNPEDFFDALKILKASGTSFRLSVIGETFRDMPKVFAQAKVLFAGHIDRWGYQADRSEYESALSEADVVVSTANHEFFGISVIEAISAGAYPVLPRRLAYPEIVAAIETASPDEFFYGHGVKSLAARLTKLAKQLEDSDKAGLWGTDSNRGQRGVSQFIWENAGRVMDDAIEQIADIA